MTIKLPLVRHLFAAYLNQDFRVTFGTSDNAIRAFADHCSPEERLRAGTEIQSILSMNFSEEEMTEFIHQKLECEYAYSTEWSSGARWLEHILSFLGPPGSVPR